MKRLILYIAGLIFLAGCSTTKHLARGGDTLYRPKADDCIEPQ